MNIESIKSQFPIFKQKTPLDEDFIYLDSASSTQKPQQVIDAISEFYSGYYANTGRGAYWPAHKATMAFEEVREKVSQFINAQSKDQIVFTSGATDSINKLVQAYVIPSLNEGDEVIVSEMEHHANLVPWQVACKAKGATLKLVSITENGDFDYQAYAELLNQRTSFVAITAISNALGTVNEVSRITKMAHETGAKVLVDASQAVAHKSIDVAKWGADFAVFSAHKMYGPTGVGVLYLANDLVNEIQPLSYGGGMITYVDWQEAGFRKGPQRHEAGTQHIGGVIGFGAALDFLNAVETVEIQEIIKDLTRKTIEKLTAIEGVHILGPKHNSGIVSFTIEGIHPHDLSTFLNERGVCVRAGHHCAQPLIQKLQLPATTRVSFGIYNVDSDIDKLVEAVIEAKAFFS